jgi:hypothetical protein
MQTARSRSRVLISLHSLSVIRNTLNENIGAWWWGASLTTISSSPWDDTR